MPLEVNKNSIGQAIADTRQLLDDHGRTVTPTTLYFATAHALSQCLTTGVAPTARTQVSDVLSDPSLTGMSRPQLAALIERLSARQDAQTERRRYRQRGGERLPGARGGVFTQKITDAERVLAVVLAQRKLCTREVLAELFEVSPRTIGTALLEIRPMLDQEGYVATPAPTRYSTAAALLASVTPPNDTPTAPEPPC